MEEAAGMECATATDAISRTWLEGTEKGEGGILPLFIFDISKSFRYVLEWIGKTLTLDAWV